jgi:hypothetical protein
MARYNGLLDSPRFADVKRQFLQGRNNTGLSKEETPRISNGTVTAV